MTRLGLLLAATALLGLPPAAVPVLAPVLTPRSPTPTPAPGPEVEGLRTRLRPSSSPSPVAVPCWAQKGRRYSRAQRKALRARGKL